MASLKDIRDRIKSVKSIQKVTSAMKMVAAAKVRKAQERMEQARPYTCALEDVIHNILPDIDRNKLDLLEVREIKRKAYVIVSADRGLAGAFNTNITKVAQKEIDEFRGKEISPGNNIYNDEDLNNFIREKGDTAYHPSCTC